MPRPTPTTPPRNVDPKSPPSFVRMLAITFCSVATIACSMRAVSLTAASAMRCSPATATSVALASWKVASASFSRRPAKSTSPGTPGAAKRGPDEGSAGPVSPFRSSARRACSAGSTPVAATAAGVVDSRPDASRALSAASCTSLQESAMSVTASAMSSRSPRKPAF